MCLTVPVTSTRMLSCCSRECYLKRRNRIREEKFWEKNSKNLKSCRGCKTLFVTTKKMKIACSRKCRNVSSINKTKPRRPIVLVQNQCVVCSSSFSVPLNKKQSKSCSKECLKRHTSHRCREWRENQREEDPIGYQILMRIKRKISEERAKAKRIRELLNGKESTV